MPFRHNPLRALAKRTAKANGLAIADFAAAITFAEQHPTVLAAVKAARRGARADDFIGALSFMHDPHCERSTSSRDDAYAIAALCARRDAHGRKTSAGRASAKAARANGPAVVYGVG